jgi:hypothetical protein
VQAFSSVEDAEGEIGGRVLKVSQVSHGRLKRTLPTL